MYEVNTPYDGIIQVYDAEEGARLILEAAHNSAKLQIGKKERARTYYNVVMSFDIETTKLLNLNWNEKLPVCFKYFNICFCWQCAVNDKFIFGRDVGLFFDMLDKVSEQLDGNIICYIHNIAYEYNNLADYFNKGIEDPENDIFFKSLSTPLYVRYHKFEFRCSKILTQKSLAKIGNDIGYPKLTSDFDYNIQRDIDTYLSPVEINYCYRDVFILNKFITMEYNNYCMLQKHRIKHVARLPLTSTGYVRKDVQKNFSNKPNGYHLLHSTALAEDEYYFISGAMWGGFTHSNYRYIGKEVEKPWHGDIKSAYPGAMVLEGFPGKLTHANSTDLATFLHNLFCKDRAVIASVTFTNIGMKKGGVPYIPWAKSKCKGELVENGKVIYADEVTLTACDVDLHIILDAYTYDTIKVNDYYFGFKQKLPYNLVSTILGYFAGKTQYKDVDGRELEYALAKALLNGIYGLSATALAHEKIVLIDGVPTALGTEYKAAKVLPYQWSIYITAYVRRLIYGFIVKLQKNNSFIYSDTDSIFFTYDYYAIKAIEEYNESIRKKLTEMSALYYNIIPKTPKGKPQYIFSIDFEDCTPEETEIECFCTIGAKRYYIKKGGLYEVTFSGLRSTKIEKDKEGNKHHGYNTQRLIDTYGSLNAAFNKIKDDEVKLDYTEGKDKLSNYNIRANFEGELNGKKYRRPCTYTLYPQSIRLKLNPSLASFLVSEQKPDYD